MRNKTIILLFFGLLYSASVQAQSMDSIPHHSFGPYAYAYPKTIMQMADSSVVGGFHLLNFTSDYYMYSEGYLMQKLTRHGARITDTTFINYKHFPSHFTGKYPFGQGNVHAELGDFVDGQSILRIQHFDDQLHFDDTLAEVALCEKPVKGAEPCMLLDEEGDLVLAFYDFEYDATHPETVHLAQVGLDGTIKLHETYPFEQIQFGLPLIGPKVFGTSPLRYACWGVNTNGQIQCLDCYVLDSLLHLTATYSIYGQISNAPQLPYQTYALQFSRNAQVLGEESGTILVGAAYDNSASIQGGSGMMLVRFDSEGNKLKHVVFPSPGSSSSPYEWPIGLEWSLDGNLYFSYTTSSSDDGTICVMKLDRDMNVIWQRCCLASGWGKELAFMKVLDDNGVAIMGNVYNGTEAFYLILNDDGHERVHEQACNFRPYACYPNPAHDALHLQYSPDVQPTQIELYDLQGRLVRTQNDHLESLNLQGLATGQYVMKVTMEGGDTFTDKVVKE